METLLFCPVCNQDKFKPFLTCKDYMVSRETFQIVECENCHLHFTNPRPEENEIGRYYLSEDYISHSGIKKGIINRAYHIIRNYTLAKKLQLILQQTQRYSPKSLSLLDYGCGAGDFLHTCKKAGFQTTGIEPQEKTRELAIKKYGLKIYPPANISSFKNHSFDIITLWHVLEHIHRLREFMEELRRILKDSGLAIIAVPNLTSLDAKLYKEFWAAFDVPRHLYHFSPEGIIKLFSDLNFELIEIKPMVFDALYVSLLSEKYKMKENGHKKNSRNLISAIYNGVKSNVFASNSEITFSSQIYLFKKTK